MRLFHPGKGIEHFLERQPPQTGAQPVSGLSPTISLSCKTSNSTRSKTNNAEIMITPIKSFTTFTGLAVIAMLSLATVPVQAGPTRLAFEPVKTFAQAEALPAKTKIAVTCPGCSAVVVSTVDKEKSYMKSFSCPVCKHTFQVESATGGRGSKAPVGSLTCKDTKTGKTMPLHLCAQMHQ